MEYREVIFVDPIKKEKKKRRALPNSVRIAVAIRHGCKPSHSIDVKCAYCDFVGILHWHHGLRWVQSSNLEFDHVVPLFLGGESIQENIVLACRRCNRSKGHKDIYNA